ncbi:MAG: hypothetical protein IRZ28_06730 [Steroidobacteraceae bacterium]|nr:hypothetical protein [Steroidobacteraceae bacterium]
MEAITGSGMKQKTYKQLTYQVSFTTPAFLGNATQDAQWRTPPLKALLRQWWRVGYAAQHAFRVDPDQMRHEEGRLFGHTWLDKDADEAGRNVSARKSLLRLRLVDAQTPTGVAWSKGAQKGIAPLSDSLSTSYAWFGLIRRGGNLPDRTAIKASGYESSRTLLLAFPAEHTEIFHRTLSLIHAFGTAGSRSRGGWGSVHLDPPDREVKQDPGLDVGAFAEYSRDWKVCLDDDWAMSLARDESGLWIWHSKNTFSQWHEAIRAIAEERKRVRSLLDKPRRAVLGFAKNGRMPSPLRWKVIRGTSGELFVRAFAMPHQLPKDNRALLDTAAFRRTWQEIVAALDASGVVARAVSKAVMR